MTIEDALLGEHLGIIAGDTDPFWFEVKYEYGLYWLAIGWSGLRYNRKKQQKFRLIAKSELVQWLERVIKQ